MNGREKLREQLEAMGHALQAFDDPLVDEHAGLRLMKDVLAARRDHIAEELATAEHCQLAITVEGAAGDAVTVDVAVPLLEAVQEAVRTFAGARAEALNGVDADQAEAAVALRVAQWHGRAVTLTGPDLPLPTRVADPDSGITLLEVALDDLLDEIEAGGHPALRGLGDLLAGQPVALTMSFSPVVGDERRVRLERRDAARLAPDED